MKTVNPLEHLIMATAHAREQYRLHGTYFWQAMYESRYVELGQWAYDQGTIQLKSPAALAAIYRLAIDAE